MAGNEGGNIDIIHASHMKQFDKFSGETIPVERPSAGILRDTESCCSRLNPLRLNIRMGVPLLHHTLPFPDFFIQCGAFILPESEFIQ